MWECFRRAAEITRFSRIVREAIFAHASLRLKIAWIFVTRLHSVFTFETIGHSSNVIRTICRIDLIKNDKTTYECTLSPLSHASSFRCQPLYQGPYRLPHQNRNPFVMAHGPWLMAHAFTINGIENKGIWTNFSSHLFTHRIQPVCFVTQCSRLAHTHCMRNESKRVLTVYYMIMTNSLRILVHDMVSFV